MACGPFESGEVINVSHIWTSKGEYNIRVKAKDIEEYESEWSDPLTVSMPKSYNQLLCLFQKFLENHPVINFILHFLT